MREIGKAACKLLLLQLLFCLWISNDSLAWEHGGRVAKTADAAQGASMVKVASNPALPEGLNSAFWEFEEDPVREKRVASALQKLGKTLILERTRGVKEVAIYRQASPAVVLVVTNEGFGSGAIIDRNGYVLTNWHVVAGYSTVVVVFKPRDGTELTKELAFRARVMKVDQLADLALLEIINPPKAFASLPLGDISALAVGQDVHAIGHPEGEIWTYTKGIISQIRNNYEWSGGDNLVHRARVIQTQTPINPGNSGGPLLDDGGKLIGINSFRSATGEGLNYAVGVDAVQAFLKRAGSRKAPPSPRAEATRGSQPKCPETYSMSGWNFVGCLVRDSAPPPDVWLVTRGNELAYAAWDSLNVNQINRVIVDPNQRGEEYYHFIDIDCDGSVDVIGRKYAGAEEIDRYRVPDKPVRLISLAREFDTALKARRIPYTMLRVCQ